MEAVRHIESLEELGRAVAAGQVYARDQVYIPAALAETMPEEAWARVQEVLGRAGASVHRLPGLAAIYVLSFDELRAGAFPPAFPGSGPSSSGEPSA